MEFSLYLKETYQTASLLQDIRDELTVAVRNAILLHAYDTDIDLSFGKIHINSKGSVSQISFNGTDVTDIDAFIVRQAFHITDDHYFDIRKNIKNNRNDFFYYPIKINGRISLTVLKSSPFFERKYGRAIHSNAFRVEYASKYLLIYSSNTAVPDVYYIGLFGPEQTANTLLEKAGKSLGGKSTITTVS